MTRYGLAILLSASLLSGCAGGLGGVTPGQHSLTPQCIGYEIEPAARHTDVTSCGSTGSSFQVAATTEGDYTSYGSGDWSSYSASGYDTNTMGATAGTSTGSTSTDVTDGTEQWVASVPSISPNSIRITAKSAWYMQAGVNYLPGGITLNAASTATGGTTAAFTDSLGRVWNILGELDADGHDVDMTFNVSGVGTWTQKFDAKAFAPTELSATSSSLAVAARFTRLTARPMVSAGAVAAVAGAVAGVAAGVAGIAALIPGGQPVALVSGAVGGVAAAVAGVAAAVDYFQSHKKQVQKK